ncbi:MAG TPA: septal ring lytic transglycosylase RlpA family protein [Flavipsychrobacter sp.]|nr:septal ring lytic transglycosylase RlpA family protein [Flavipsychrobacter sp.]
MRLLLITALFILSANCVNAQRKGTSNILTSIKKGIASFYHDKFEGRKTATGEVFDNDKFTAASNTLKLGTYVKVTNISNGEVIYVRVNDRMAKDNNRLIDLASIAAKKLNFHKKGITSVKVEAVPENEGRKAILSQNGFQIPQGNKL